VLSDEDLMSAAAGGDMNAFEQIVLRYQDMVWRVAVRFIGNAAEAQDITQMVFLKLFEAAPRYRVSALLKTYLFRIVNTTCIDFSRKNRTVAVDDLSDVPDGSPSVIDGMVAREKDGKVRQAIDALPVRQRAAVLLRYEAELSICEIADILNAGEKAVERLLAHAREALFKVLKVPFGKNS
jgi:RNA polymerase sigma-70 factor, ECF subfamily